MNDTNTPDSAYSGFSDHHSLKSETTKLDLNHRASKEVKDKVWDIIQNGYKEEEAPLPDGYIEVEVPEEYVGAAVWTAAKVLSRLGARTGFSVMKDKDAPQFYIEYMYPDIIEVPGRPKGYRQNTNCLAAYMALKHKKDQDFLPENVGKLAVEMFMRKLSEVNELV